MIHADERRFYESEALLAQEIVELLADGKALYPREIAERITVVTTSIRAILLLLVRNKTLARYNSRYQLASYPPEQLELILNGQDTQSQ